MSAGAWILAGPGVALPATYDLFPKKHASLRSFPVVGHFRRLLESIGPEVGPYIVTSGNEERPFSRPILSAFAEEQRR